MSFYPPVSSYDFHIYYHYKSQPSLQEAIELKNSIFKDFNDEVESDEIIVKVLRNEEVRGPHITAFFEVDVQEPSVFVKFFSWIQLNHGSLSVLIHPNSDDTYLDHTHHAAWLGDKIPLLEETLKGKKFYDPNYGFPSRKLIADGFYKDPEQYKKSIMIRLLQSGPDGELYDKDEFS